MSKMADTWTPDQAAIPTQLLAIMEACEYHLACSDAPQCDRIAALTEVIEWCHDLRVTCYTDVPMADSDRFPQRVRERFNASA